MQPTRIVFMRHAARALTIAACGVLCLTTTAQAQTPCEAEPTDMSVAFGDQITCPVGAGGDTDIFRFSGVAGDRVLTEALKVGGEANFLPRIQILAPNGTQIGLAQSPAIVNVVLPQTGTYTAIVFDYNGTYAGDVRFTASCVAGACVPTPPAPPHPAPERSAACEPEPTDMFPFLGTRVTCAIGVGGDTDVYRFDAREGDRILAEVVKMGGHANFLPRIQLIAPDGAQVALAQSPAWAHLSLTQTGVYTAIVFDYNGTYDGDYVFTVSCTGGPCLSLRSVPTVSLTLTGCTVCAPGNVLQVEAHWQNLGPSRVAEVKLGVRAPNGTPYNLFGDKHLEYMFLPGFDLTGTFISLPWPSGLPAGQWTVEATLIGPDLGDTFSRDVKVFTATP